jgi:hypothetical protein
LTLKVNTNTCSSSDEWDRDSVEYLTSNLETKVNETDKEMCDKEVSINEILNAAKLQKPDKSPGDDGISSEFLSLIFLNKAHVDLKGKYEHVFLSILNKYIYHRYKIVSNKVPK